MTVEMQSEEDGGVGVCVYLSVEAPWHLWWDGGEQVVGRQEFTPNGEGGRAEERESVILLFSAQGKRRISRRFQGPNTYKHQTHPYTCTQAQGDGRVGSEKTQICQLFHPSLCIHFNKYRTISSGQHSAVPPSDWSPWLNRNHWTVNTLTWQTLRSSVVTVSN